MEDSKGCSACDCCPEFLCYSCLCKRSENQCSYCGDPYIGRGMCDACFTALWKEQQTMEDMLKGPQPLWSKGSWSYNDNEYTWHEKE